MLKLYDTLTKKKRTFKPLKDKKVSMYSCGPTVYNYVHLGNLRAYIFVDILKRYLRYSGYKVNHVMNITDVDDKTIKGSRIMGQTLKEFTNFYLRAFLEDLKSINIESPTMMPKATDFIKEMVKITKQLLKKGYAYRADARPDEPLGRGSIYFRISKAKNYGRLADLKRKEITENTGGRLSMADEYKKEDADDFVLWKSWKPEDGDVFWETEIGKGRPGWHIECSAMSMALLGKTLDIHCGGVDLIFPHHTNEIAQSEAITGKKFVNYWLHNEHMLIDAQKMSKSLGNFHTLKDVVERGYNPMFLRILLMKTHYRQILDFSFDNFIEAKSISEKFINFLFNLDLIENGDKNKLDINESINNYGKKFREAMNDDLNISEALAAIFNFMSEINKSVKVINVKQAGEIRRFILKIDGVLGFIEKIYEDYLIKLGNKIKDTKVGELLKKREEARKSGNFQESDILRDKIQSLGFVLEDTKSGFVLRLKEW